MKPLSKRLLSRTRGRIVHLLRRGEASVSDLASELNVTDNAVRAQLTTLERDHLVRISGKRPGLRKPETLYALTTEAEKLFPKAYDLLFNLLLDAISQRLPPEDIQEMLRAIGARLATAQGIDVSADLEVRLNYAQDVLNQLGGLAEVQEQADRFLICGYSCPLGQVVKQHPEACLLAEALLTELIGRPVQERCERNGTPRCVFEVSKTQ